MEAHNYSVKDWIFKIRNKQIALPRFQRFESWGPSLIVDFLTSIFRGMPVGVCLILETGGKPQFEYRYFYGVDKTNKGKPNELLLDGQQRLTALWRALNNNYKKRSYYIDLEQGEDNLAVIYVSRWISKKNNQEYPLWIHDPHECWKRKKIPLNVLNPDDEKYSTAWVNEASGNDLELRYTLSTIVMKLREQIAHCNIPYLLLPYTTPPEDAADVFIKLNTTYVKLTAFDVIVAQVEEAVGESLHELVEDLVREAPQIEDYIEPGNFALTVAALLQDKLPNQKGFFNLDPHKTIEDWEKLTQGTQELVSLLEDETIFDRDRLPSETVLAPIAALLANSPQDPDEFGSFRSTLVQYMWLAFLTDKYDRAVSQEILQDYRELIKVREQKISAQKLQIFNRNKHPLPTLDLIEQASWPKKKDRLARSILILSLQQGAIDFAEAKKISRLNINQREYHHLYPVGFLKRKGIPDYRASVALNCALVSWKTNRKISDKDPLTYLRQRTGSSGLGQVTIANRLATHLIDFDSLNRGHFDKFISDRAEQVMQRIKEKLQLAK